MQAVRHLLAQRLLAVLICASALLLKLLVPTGYMIGTQHGTVSIMICSGVASDTMSMPGMDGEMEAMGGVTPDHDEPKEHGKFEMPCAFAGLSSQALAAVDPVLLVEALAVVAANALLAKHRPVLRPAPFLRPPLRGPPLSLN